MRHADLNRAVAQATGESVTTIKRLGFLLAEPDESLDPVDTTLGPQVIDWDDRYECFANESQPELFDAPLVA